MHALIIEDESLIALAIEEALRDCGFTSFDLAVSAEEAVAAATRRCPDLITADVELRPGCGIEAVHSICSEAAIPVLFITGSPNEGQGKNAWACIGREAIQRRRYIGCDNRL